MILFLYRIIIEIFGLSFLGIATAALLIHPLGFEVIIDQGLSTAIMILLPLIILIFSRPQNLFNLLLPICFVLVWMILYMCFDRNWSFQEYFDLLLFRGSSQEIGLTVSAFSLCLLRELINRLARSQAEVATKKLYDSASKLWFKIRHKMKI